jgi:O-antigen ligase
MACRPDGFRRAGDERVSAVVADSEVETNEWIRALLDRWRLAVDVVALAEIVVGMAGLLTLASPHFGLLLFLGAVAVLCIVLGLRSPVLACTYLLIATFFRLAIPSGTFPVDPFVIAFAGVVASTWLWMAPRRRNLSAVDVDPILCAIVLYIAWNVMSMVLPHPYPPGSPLDSAPFSVQRFIVIGIVMPLAMFLVGHWVFTSVRAIRVLLWSMVSAAAYSAVVSIFQFAAPALVWPRYIVDDPHWVGRANGVFNQPIVNGLVLIVGFLAAMLIASHAVEPRLLRGCAAAVAVASACGVYLTHTRAVWLAFALVVLVGAVAGRGFRSGFVLTLGVMVLAVASNWSIFTSSDRSAGGVGSPSEVEDRLNSIATSIWAFEQKPLTGWGIGRFAAVNTYHHQQYSPEVPWQSGFGIASHFDALGILVELGIIGLAFWMVALILIYTRLVRATRQLPAGEMYGRPLGLTALLCLVAQSTTGLTVDLRFFDFPNIIVMLLAGAAIGWQREQARWTAARHAVTGAPVSSIRHSPVREAVHQ